MSTRKILLNVLRAEARPMTIRELAKRIGASPRLVRYHVQALAKAGEAQAIGVAPAINGRLAQMFRSAPTAGGTQWPMT